MLVIKIRIYHRSFYCLLQLYIILIVSHIISIIHSQKVHKRSPKFLCNLVHYNSVILVVKTSLLIEEHTLWSAKTCLCALRSRAIRRYCTALNWSDDKTLYQQHILDNRFARFEQSIRRSQELDVLTFRKHAARISTYERRNSARAERCNLSAQTWKLAQGFTSRAWSKPEETLSQK